jgi:PIN domain nuclease of toxin-antitoxin system
VRVLLDTHIFIWACVEPERLSPIEQSVIASPDNQVLVSAATAWEISIKEALGRLEFPVDRLQEFIDLLGFESLAMSLTHAAAAGRLPRHHEDPFDRMLIAQASIESLTLVSRDRLFAHYGLKGLSGN